MINETQPGRLADYLIGDLGIARRHIARLIALQMGGHQHRVLLEVQRSLESCVERIERDVRPIDQAANEALDPSL